MSSPDPNSKVTIPEPEMSEAVNVSIPSEWLKRIDEITTKDFYKDRDDFIQDAVRRALGKPPKVIFFKGRKFGIPHSSFILLALPQQEHAKLDEWQVHGDQIHILAGHQGEVWLTNETRLDKWRRRRDAKNRIREEKAPEK